MNDAMQRFIEDRAALTGNESRELTQWLEENPAALDELRGQLVVEELLHRHGDAGRRGFVERVRNHLPVDPFVAQVLQRTQQRTIRWRRTFSWAAAAALVMASVLLLFRPEKDLVRLVTVSGEVRVWREQVTMPAKNGLVLKAGDWLLTGKDGAAEIEFPGEATRLKIGASGEFGFVAALPGKELKLTTGTLHARVARQSASHPMMVRTPTAKAEVLGTEFEMNATKERTQMTVHEGRVLIARHEDESGVVVEAQQTARVTGMEPVAITTPPAAQSLSAGLIAHWKFDGNTADASGNGRDLTMSAAGAWSAGRFGQALDFHEAKPDVELPRIALPGEFSVSLWLQIQAGTARPQPVLGFDDRASGLNALWVTLPPTYPGSGVVVEVSGQTMGSQAFSQADVIRVSRWHHLVIRVNSEEGSVRMFIDGRDQTATGGLRRGFKIGGPLLIGRRVRGGAAPFDGQLDDLRIYDRELTPDEIAELAKGDAAR
jgi:Concanavalin A-like lectin/glucanases superfamily/FecR protein